MAWTIYRVQNTDSKKAYVGCTSNLKMRLKRLQVTHQDLFLGSHSVIVLATRQLIEEAEEAEKQEIQRLFGDPGWVALNKRGGGFRGYKQPPNVSETLRRIHTGRKISEETRAKFRARKPYKWTQEQKEAASLRLRGHKISKESRLKMSQAKLGKIPMKAVLASAEARRGKPAWNRGIPMTEDAKKRASKSLTGRTHSAETIRKMSEAASNRKKGPDGSWIKLT